MKVQINPVRIFGNWKEGYALDNHVVSSEYIGEDVYGNPIYATLRTELGELLYRYKYCGAQDKLNDIIVIAKPFLDQWKVLKYVDIILPVPSSVKDRSYQPAVEIARAIAEYLNIAFNENVIINKTDEQSKNMQKNQKDIEGKIIAVKKAKRDHNILLVDDLYSTGSTLMECVKVLKEDEKLKDIFVLTVTKTR